MLSAACGDDDSSHPSDGGTDAGDITAGNSGSGGKTGSAGKSGAGGASGHAAVGGNGGRGGNAAAGAGGRSQAGNGGRGGSSGSGGNQANGGSGGTAAGSGGSNAAGAGAGGMNGGSGGSTIDDAGVDDDGGTASANISFFVSSTTHSSGDLGGLSAADALCQSLASDVGAGSKTWHAYLSTGTVGSPSNARDRIGSGPWYNAKGVMVAQDLSALHARTGDANVFIDEHGHKINGHWTGSPTPVQHDILTGSNAQGELLPDNTCSDWTSNSSALQAMVGHSDGLGPNGDTSGTYSSWNAAHLNMDCSNTAPLGGAGRIYCFATN
jgi:hypothetical protein